MDLNNQLPSQITHTVIMVRPDHFGYNSETAKTNMFQHTPAGLSKTQIRDQVLAEFAHVVANLRAAGVHVIVLPSRTDVITPDALFPNNWFSYHQDGTLIFYTMLTPNRRLERQKDAVLAELKKLGIQNPNVLDLTNDEEKGEILEGTGSMILDRVNKVSFAMESSRTHRKAFDRWCKLTGYEGVFIKAPMYHTNMAMCIGEKFAVVCLEVIPDKKERANVKKKLQSLGKEVIPITRKQVDAMCGNILQLQSTSGERLIVMSEAAKKHFSKQQLECLKQHGTIVATPIPTIENVGGGGVRCMLAEVFIL